MEGFDVINPDEWIFTADNNAPRGIQFDEVSTSHPDSTPSFSAAGSRA
jgi:hypothetical protein